MENFKTAFDKTMAHEEGYANDPDDLGGETIRGIARAYHPKWLGWAKIDLIKAHGNTTAEQINAIVKSDPTLIHLILEFYRDEFWDKIRGDELPLELSMEMFDTAVNMSPSRAIEFLQEGLNLSNRNQKDYPDILVDSKLGPTTMNTLKLYQTKSPRDIQFLINIMNILQGCYYINRYRQSPTQEKYHGWFNRVIIKHA